MSEEEERLLVHQAARGYEERRRAELLKEIPDPQLVAEGNAAYGQLVSANQHLVLSVAQEYFGEGRDAGEIIKAGNIGLAFSINTFGLKKQTPFRTYALHSIHLQIIEELG